jgi:FlaA1/EpsC-like NDP-sugar epimerase
MTAGLLDRPERPAYVHRLDGRRVVVTGGDGYLGRRCVALLRAAGADPVSFDHPLDVLDREAIEDAAVPGAWCLHLAAHKHAPAGEDLPATVADLNVRGAQHVAETFGDRVVRLVNVLGSSGSVLSLWDALPDTAPLPVTDNLRMWMTSREAAHLLVAALAFPSGRYVPVVPQAEPVALLAERAYPGRRIEWVPARRGDRDRERLVAEYEVAFPFVPGVARVVHPADKPSPAGAPYAPALLSV